MIALFTAKLTPGSALLVALTTTTGILSAVALVTPAPKTDFVEAQEPGRRATLPHHLKLDVAGINHQITECTRLPGPTSSGPGTRPNKGQWLRPLIHVLLSCGITWREFAELSKTTYVQVASENFGKRGRPTNVSRTAILTGLARRDVRKQRWLLSKAPKPLTGYVTKASLVLSAWHLDPRFRNPKGKPAILRMEGAGKSFSSLIESAGGTDVKPSTLLKELVSAGAVRIRRDGRLQAVLRDYIPHSMDEQLIRLWGTVIADVATTYVHNLTRTEKGVRRFERSAVNERIPLHSVAEFQQLLHTEGQKFLELIDTWLTAHECRTRAGKDMEQTVRLGIGLYQIQD